MSKHMQLTVQVRPYYKKDMKADYPKIAQGLSYIHEAWVEEGPSLFDIVGKLDKLLYELEGNPPFRKILLKHTDGLHKLYTEVEAYIGDWDLAKADKTLYQIEDIFDQIEWELR
ncbi:MAG: hypothetical protein C0611_01750 [Desulfobacteraceae bacterium]|nr:hypothetical protein [Desulfobacteraceae bacterium]MDH3873320.1 hypothetical protein [Desulfobacteraceae bacterium]PLX54122.1 MAG: hypothetical protein C0611_01750 [Desulfobacteraceae bacterium]